MIALPARLHWARPQEYYDQAPWRGTSTVAKTCSAPARPSNDAKVARQPGG